MSARHHWDPVERQGLHGNRQRITPPRDTAEIPEGACNGYAPVVHLTLLDSIPRGIHLIPYQCSLSGSLLFTPLPPLTPSLNHQQKPDAPPD